MISKFAENIGEEIEVLIIFTMNVVGLVFNLIFILGCVLTPFAVLKYLFF